MQALIDAARAVVDNWEKGDLAAAVRDLQAALPDQADEATRKRAVELYADDDIEIDDVAYTTKGDEGMWVSAWVWVPGEEDEGEGDADG